MTFESVRIWLSGSIPESVSHEDRERILRFVSAFATEVFKRGGHLVHGSHPTIREELLRAATAHNEASSGLGAGLVLAVSRFFSKEPAKWGIDLDAWNNICVERIIETPEALAPPSLDRDKRRQELDVPHTVEEWEDHAKAARVTETDRVLRGASLKILRDTMVEQCNSIVALGGKGWETTAHQAGVPLEVELARTKGLPLFLLGTMGGSLRAYLARHPELFRECRNGLTEEQNRELASLNDPDELARRTCDQLDRLPLRPRSRNSARPFRILCLDGGGICGLFTAAVLRRWAEMTGREIVDHFDMIAGTSTGGILAIGLALGMKPEVMEKFYVNHGAKIFPTDTAIGSLTHGLRHWFTSKFDASVLRNALTAAYCAAPVQPPKDDYRTRLVIPIYNSQTDLPDVFRAWPDSTKAPYRTFDPVEVALGTAAAPTYFQPHNIGHIRSIDGGVWGNSPSTIALSEAIHGLGVEAERIHLLSVGTTHDTKLVGRPAQIDRGMIEALVRPATNGIVARLVGAAWKPMPIEGKLGWLPNIAGFLMKTQSQTANYVCKRVLGDRYLRVDVATEPTSLDDVRALNLLIGLGEYVADQYEDDVRAQFLNGVPAIGP